MLLALYILFSATDNVEGLYGLHSFVTASDWHR